jgi:5'-3' exonuclease
MGTNGFTKFYGRRNLERFLKKIKNFYGKIVVIDAYIQLYRMSIGKIGRRPINSQDNKFLNGKRHIFVDNKQHVYDLYNFTVQLISRQIIPFYVFDGGAPEEKSECLAKRNNIKEKAITKLKGLEGNSDEAYKQQRKGFKLTHGMITDCIGMLELMGIGYVIAPKESDEQLVAIYNFYSNPNNSYVYTDDNGKTHTINLSGRMGGIITNDTDVFTFGGKTALLNFSFTTDETSEISIKDLKRILQEKADLIAEKKYIEKVKIKFDDFVNFSILMGTDYQKTLEYQFRYDVDVLFEIFVTNNLDVKSTVNFVYREESQKTSGNDYIVNIATETFMENFNKIKNLYKTSRVYRPENIRILPKNSYQTIEQLQDLIMSCNHEAIPNGLDNISEYEDYIRFRDMVSKNIRDSADRINAFLLELCGKIDTGYESFSSYGDRYYCNQAKQIRQENKKKYEQILRPLITGK